MIGYLPRTEFPKYILFEPTYTEPIYYLIYAVKESMQVSFEIREWRERIYMANV